MRTTERISQGITNKQRRAGPDIGDPRRHRCIVTKGHPVGFRLAAPVATDSQPYQAGVRLHDGLGVDTQLLQCPRARPFYYDICMAQQRLQLMHAGGAGEIEGHTGFSGIEQMIEIAIAGKFCFRIGGPGLVRRHPAGPCSVGPLQALDLYHPRTCLL